MIQPKTCRLLTTSQWIRVFLPQRPRARDGQAKPLADVSLRLEDGEQYQPQAETKTDKNTRSEPALDILKRIKRKAVFSLPMPAT
jgi:hypothetical protein